MFGKALQYLVIVSAVVLVAACIANTPSSSPFVASSSDQIGSAEVAVLSVSPWAEVQSDLQPNFKIDEVTALSLAVPTTQQLDERLSQAFSAALRLAALQRTRKSTVTEESVSGAAQTQTTNTTETRATGDVSSLAAPKPPAASASGLPAASEFTPNAVDPMLQYLAAASVYQEIKMLNRYVRDAVVASNAFASQPRAGAKPAMTVRRAARGNGVVCQLRRDRS